MANSTIKLSATSEIEAGDPTVFTFNADTNPLVNRSIASARIGMDQGPSFRRINITLTGFFLGNKSEEVMIQIDALIAMLKSNQLTFYYHDGARVVENRKVYVADYNDPAEWKQYTGVYNIQLYYFQDSTNNEFDNVITASYDGSEGSYHFDPPPSVSMLRKPNRPSHRSKLKSPKDLNLGSMIQMSLDGFLIAANYAALKAKIDELNEAFSEDGTLNYGTFSKKVYVGTIQMPSAFPLNHVFYSIELFYDTEEIVELDMTRTFSRIHKYPRIIENPYCDTKDVKLFGASSQIVTYEFRCEGYDRDAVRAAIANEAQMLVYPNGVELPGGTEKWNEMKAEVMLSFQKWYEYAQLSNLPNT